MWATKDTKESSIRVGMIQSLSMIDPVMLIQYIQIQLRVHPFPRTPRRKGPAPSH